MKKLTYSALILSIILLGAEKTTATSLSSPPPGTVIQRDNLLMYVNEVGEEVFLTYKSGKRSKNDLKVLNQESRSKKFRGRRTRSTDSVALLLKAREKKENPSVYSAAPKQESTKQKKTQRRAKQVSYRGRRTEQHNGVALRNARKKKAELGYGKLVSHRKATRKTKSRIKRRVKTDLTEIKKAYANTKVDRLEKEREENRKKALAASRIKENVEIDFTKLQEAQSMPKAKRLAEKLDNEIRKSLPREE